MIADNMFGIYVFGLWPVFTILFVREVRKDQDVTVMDLLFCIIVGALPFFREIAYIWLKNPEDIFNKVLWEKK